MQGMTAAGYPALLAQQLALKKSYPSEVFISLVGAARAGGQFSVKRQSIWDVVLLGRGIHRPAGIGLPAVFRRGGPVRRPRLRPSGSCAERRVQVHRLVAAGGKSVVRIERAGRFALRIHHQCVGRHMFFGFQAPCYGAAEQYL